MGFVNASAAASGVNRPTPISSQRSQKVADSAFSVAANPGVPASASRNGASLRTSWLTFNNGCPHRLIERLRLVQQQHQRLRSAAGHEQPGQGPKPAAQLPARPAEPDGEGQRIRRHSPESAGRRHLGGQRVQVPDSAGRHPEHIDGRLPGLDLLLKPPHERGLAVTPSRPCQHGDARCAAARPHVGQEAFQDRLLGVSSGQVRRQLAIIGNERIELLLVRHAYD